MKHSVPKLHDFQFFSIALQTLLNVSNYSLVMKNNYALLKTMAHQKIKKMDTTYT